MAIENTCIGSRSVCVAGGMWGLFIICSMVMIVDSKRMVIAK